MKTEIIAADSPHAIQRALDVLQAGGLVAFPTDTVYGVGARAFDGKAVEAIYTAKGRAIEKAIPVLIGDGEDITKTTSEVPAMARKLAERFWPGPLTIILPKRSDLPDSVSATNTVGVRVPDHMVARRVLRAARPAGSNPCGLPDSMMRVHAISACAGEM